MARRPPAPVTLADTAAAAKRAAILAALEAERGDVSAAAARLGIQRRAMYALIQRHGLAAEVEALRDRLGYRPHQGLTLGARPGRRSE